MQALMTSVEKDKYTSYVNTDSIANIINECVLIHFTGNIYILAYQILQNHMNI